MANFYGQTRTNYFAVKDEAAFREELAKYPVEIITKTGETGETLFGFIDADPDGAGDVFSYYDHEQEDSVDIDWSAVFIRHLADDWVAVIISSGAEKHRYISGFANAYNNNGEAFNLDLWDIYALARDLGNNITSAEY